MKALVACLLLFTLSLPARADLANETRKATKPLVAAAGIVLCFRDLKSEGETNSAARYADAIVISNAVAEFTKTKTKNGFPSGHTTAAFAAAAVLSKEDPKRKVLYYGAACVLGYTNVRTHHHTWDDVIGGAALGITIGNWSMSAGDGLLIGRVFKF
jgi:membrane-associated phospholipid phosphatase